MLIILLMDLLRREDVLMFYVVWFLLPFWLQSLFLELLGILRVILRKLLNRMIQMGNDVGRGRLMDIIYYTLMIQILLLIIKIQFVLKNAQIPTLIKSNVFPIQTSLTALFLTYTNLMDFSVEFVFHRIRIRDKKSEIMLIYHFLKKLWKISRILGLFIS